LIDPMTRKFMRDAGIGPGMRVLDVGSGGGHVALLVGGLVGDSGEVVGVDRSSAAVDAATAEAQARSVSNVTFEEGDPGEMQFERPFDAVVGRYVLQFQRNPAEFLHKVAAHVRPGGLVVFHELDWGGVRSFPPSPTHDACCGWITRTIRSSGAETNMGLKLHPTFIDAGLEEPSMRMEALVGGGSRCVDALQQVVDLVGTLLPAMEHLGVATAEEVGYDTLLERMTSETLAGGGVIVGRLQVGCWSRVQ
jgi:SAM-dependent methyltransferase